MTDVWLLVPWAPSPKFGPALKVASLGWDEGYVVRGTEDVLEAQRAVVQYQRFAQGKPAFEAVPPPAHRVGWFRWNPCSPQSCGQGHAGHLDDVTGPGYGRWRGVYLAWGGW